MPVISSIYTRHAPIITENISAVASRFSTCSTPKAAVPVAPKAAPEVTRRTRASVVTLEISLMAAPEVALKLALKSKFIRASKPRAATKPKPAEIIKYKDKTIKLYTPCTCSAKAPAIKGGQGIKSKSKLSKAIIFILDRESLSSNNISTEDNNKDREIIEV